MRVNDRELTLWSFLMSTAHGAGLMVAPVILGLRASQSGGHDDMAMLAVLARSTSPRSGSRSTSWRWSS